ncbi:MAG TPA: DPP IV N-terminal domain-containing protein [Longimicrobiaceae bacterium]|nr:DPP IV N-terminal domain-containing protein [Longimicrobiaceae bacterium]
MQTRALPALAGVTLALTLLAPAPRAGAQQQTQQELSVERIFGSGDFRLQSLPALHWMNDGQRFSFVQADSSGATDLWIEDARTGRRTRVVEGRALMLTDQTRPIEIEDYAWSADERKLLIYTNSQPVWRQNTKGHYYVLELAGGRLTPVSTRPGWQQFAKFSPDGTRVGFVRDNDLHVTDLATGSETRLTRDGSETVINGTFDWVYEEELGVQDGWRWSPDGTRIAFWQIDQSAVKTFYWINDTRDVYAEPVSLRYPKAGSANPTARVGVVALAGGDVRWMDTGADREVYLARLEWAESPGELVIQRLNRHQNRLDVLLADAATGRSRVLFTESDPAWVDVDEDLRFVNGGRQLLWTSERDGHNHLYLYNRDGTLARQLTRGAWEVVQVTAVDGRGGWVYFTATEEGPAQRQLYRVRLDGSGFAQVSTEPGTHNVLMADGSPFYLDAHSRAGVPPLTRLHTAAGEPVRTLVDNTRVRDLLAGAGLGAQEFFTFRTSDGVELNGWMIKPPGFDPSRKYPVVLYVYGGPGSQTVVDSWGGSRYLFHQMLAQKGYIVASVDNRGTGGRGREFEKVTYLNLGQYEARDQIEAAQWLARQPYVDAARLGIWGWSYGGYMTALTMMQPSSPFKAGISVAPVAHWGLYDTIYTERYMRTPQENPEGYRRSAPTENAANLRGELLLVHGTGDDNVHFQNSVQLADRLQAAGKQFTFMAYPNRTHSISGGRTSLHLYTMLANWLEQNL